LSVDIGERAPSLAWLKNRSITETLRPLATDSADSPHLLAPQVSAEVYWGHADNDQSMTRENIATLDRAMDDNGVCHTTEVYENATHGYTMSDMGAYDAAACKRHFDALFALLKTHGS
jgi:carboxymethylenebutenolidase